MNYRHAFHAGNFADVMKHALLVRILVHLARKEAPFRVIDTHAGIGRYDLGGDEAARTGEAGDGVGRMDEPFTPEVEALLAPYRTVLAETRARYGETTYPGSPAIIREMLRRDDRAVLLEKHPDDAALLVERFHSVRNMKVFASDGWTVLPGLVPPKERRGLVLIDPPYEEPDELLRLPDRLARLVARWPTGTVALWYPIKGRPEIDAFARILGKAVPREVLRLEILVDDPRVRTRLNGCGIVVVNPPWTLAGEAETLLPALAKRLARGPACDTTIDVLATA